MIKDLFDKNLILESERLLLRPIKESDTDDIDEVISKMSSTQMTKALKDVMVKYMEKLSELDFCKQKLKLQ